MIYISENALTIKTQRLRASDNGEEYTFVLLNSMTNVVRTLLVEDEGDEYVMSFTIPASFAKSVTSGEYTWSIQDSLYRVVASGVARKKETRFPADTVYNHSTTDTEYIGIDRDYNYYTVSISASLGGYLIVNGQVYQTYSESVREGRILTVQAVPGEHYTFDSWSDGVQDAERVITVTEDITLAATYEAMEYTVSISAGSDGSVSVNGVQGDYQATLQYGTVLTLEADGDTGYGFTGWSDGNTDNPRQYVVDGDTTLTAAFAVGMYMVNITAGQNGAILVNGIPGNYSQTVSYGTQLVLEATPSSGYDFTEWSDGNSDNPRTLTVTGPVTLASSYAAESYAVSIVSEDTAEGNVVVNGTTGDYSHNVAYGTTLTISVSPSQHYSFVMWSDGIIAETRTVTVTGPLTLTAVFTIDTYNVSITSGSNGYVSVNGVIGDYTQVLPYGTVLAIEADPNTGYDFTQWSDGSTTASRSVTVTGDLTLSASFAIQTFSVSISAGQDGSVSVNGTPGDYSATVDYGTVLTATATADQDYEFTQWSDGDTDNPRTITVTSNVTLSAAFEEAVQPSALNTIKYTTTDSQVNNSWLTAYDENNNVLTPTQAGRYGRIVYGEPVRKIVINSANAGNISSITTGYRVEEVTSSGLNSLTNCTSLTLKSPHLTSVDFTVLGALQYIESWHANNDATLNQINSLENNNGVCVTRTDNNLWSENVGWLHSWTFTALGTSYTYEAQQQVDLTDHNVYNCQGGPISPVNHTFSDGVGTVTYNETIGEFRDNWDGFNKVYWPDTLGYIDYSYGWTCDVELGEYAGVVGGGQYASGNWNYQNLFGGGLVPNCTVTVKETNPILTIGTDGCIYNKEDWMGLYVAGQALDSNNYVTELVMDDRCVDASTCMLGGMKDTDGITRLVLGDSCQSLKLYERAGYGEFSIRVGELVLNDALRSVNPNREYITHASGGSNNPYLNVINNGYAIESEDGTTLYWCGDSSVDLSGYTVFAESCCGGLYFSSMPNISSATQVDRNAFTDVSGISTWVWPSNTVTFNGSHILKSNDITRMEFGTAPVFNNNESESLFQLGNISELVFNSETLPTQADQYNPLFQELPQSGTIYIPVGSDYSTFLNYDGNGNLRLWTVKYLLDDNQLAIKHTPGVTITAPTITGLNVTESVDTGGWLKVTYDNDIVTYNSTSLVSNADVLEVVLPDGCTSIGNDAFSGCSGLAKVTVSDSCTSIGDTAFYGTAITEFSANGVTSFGPGAFGNCTSLERVDFGENLTTLGNSLFDNCTSLEEINFSAVNGPTITNNNLGSNIHSTGTIYIPMYVNYASYADFIGAMPSGWTVVRRKQNQILYQTNDGQPIDSVPGSMQGAPLISHIYQNGWGVIEYAGSSIYSIDGYTFTWKRNMTYLSLPELQDAVDWNAFSGCESLTTLEIGDCRRINGNSFEYCPIVNGPDTNTLTLPPSLETMDGGAFPSFAGTTVMFGPNLTRISSGAINLQNATDIYVYTENTMSDEGNPFTNVPASGTLHIAFGIGNVSYWTNYLPGWTVVYNVSLIRYTSSDNKKVEPLANAFGSAELVYNVCDSNGNGALWFKGTLTSISANAFNGCANLSSAEIVRTDLYGHTLSTIGSQAFANTGLTSIVLPSSVTTLNGTAFTNCDLTDIRIDNGPNGSSSTISDNKIYSYYNTTERKLIAKVAHNSSNVRSDTVVVGTSDVTIPDSVMYIGNDAFRGNDSLTSVTFSHCQMGIGSNSFADCANLRELRFVNTNSHVPTVGTGAFSGVRVTGRVYGVSGLDYSNIMAALPSGWTLTQ